jgi:hypothetical protein
MSIKIFYFMVVITTETLRNAYKILIRIHVGINEKQECTSSLSPLHGTRNFRISVSAFHLKGKAIPVTGRGGP